MSFITPTPSVFLLPYLSVIIIIKLPKKTCYSTVLVDRDYNLYLVHIHYTFTRTQIIGHIIVSTGALVADIVRYLRATWSKYGNVEAYVFHHTKGFESTRSSPSMYCFPATARYVSTSSLDRTLKSCLETRVRWNRTDASQTFVSRRPDCAIPQLVSSMETVVSIYPWSLWR